MLVVMETVYWLQGRHPDQMTIRARIMKTTGMKEPRIARLRTLHVKMEFVQTSGLDIHAQGSKGIVHYSG